MPALMGLPSPASQGLSEKDPEVQFPGTFPVLKRTPLPSYQPNPPDY